MTEDVKINQTEPLKIYCCSCQQKLDVTGLEPFSVVACPYCQASLIVPKWFDSYLLEEKVGEGGMATVYRALDLALDREVAIKIMAVNEDADANFHSLFLEEARTAATINHQAVVAIYTCSVAENKPYIVMEFMGGGSLEEVLEEKKNTLDILQVCEWMQNIADGLDRGAKYGIIHHDIKPANIMLDMEGNVKIGDFGIAQRRFGQATSGEENSFGSPYYVSPEKARDGEESFPGDIYSLGATFYHLLTGVPPFHSYENIEELVYTRIEKDPPPPSSVRREIPPEVDALILKMLHRTPEKRPNYQEIRADIASIVKKYKAVWNAGVPKAGVSFLPPAANDSGFFPIVQEEKESSNTSRPDSRNEFASVQMERKAPEKSVWTHAAFIIGSILASAIVFFVLFIVFRVIFASMKG